MTTRKKTPRARSAPKRAKSVAPAPELWRDDLRETAFYAVERELRGSPGAKRVAAAITEALERSTDDADAPWTIRAAVLSGEVNVDVHELLSAHPAPCVRQAIALMTPIAPLLVRLAVDRDAYVRAAAAHNPRTPVDALIPLVDDSSRLVRGRLAGNPAGGDALVALARSFRAWRNDGSEMAVLAANPGLPDAVRPVVAAHPVVGELTGAGDAHIHAWDRQTAWQSLGDKPNPAHPSVPVSWLPIVLGDNVELTARHVAQHPWLPPSLHATLARHDYFYARAAIAERDDIAPALIERLASDESDVVRAAVARNPMTPDALFDALCDDPDGDVRAACAASPRCPVDRLARYAGDDADDVRWAVAWNAAAPAGAIEKLAADTVDTVRRWTSLHPALSPASVDRLCDDDDDRVAAYARFRRVADE